MPLLNLVLALIAVVVAAWFVNTYGRMQEKVKPILNIVLALMIVGMALWLINVYVPMAASIKAILNILVVVATCVWVLQALGLWDNVVRLWGRMVHAATTHHNDDHPDPTHEKTA